MSEKIRNRIKGHRRVRAGELLAHEWNFRAHPGSQKRALEGIYQEVGFARSLLAYEMPDGRLKLIDGHLRRDIDPDMEVDVEVLDVDDEEARKLLLSIDPLAALAETQAQLHERLAQMTPTESPELKAVWEGCMPAPEQPAWPAPEPLVEQFYILVTCRDEQQQVELLQRFQQEALSCKALLS